MGSSTKIHPGYMIGQRFANLEPNCSRTLITSIIEIYWTNLYQFYYSAIQISKAKFKFLPSQILKEYIYPTHICGRDIYSLANLCLIHGKLVWKGKSILFNYFCHDPVPCQNTDAYLYINKELSSHYVFAGTIRYKLVHINDRPFNLLKQRNWLSIVNKEILPRTGECHFVSFHKVPALFWGFTLIIFS